MDTTSRVTTDHETIKHWTEERHGEPATVEGTAGQGEEAGLLRIKYPEAHPDDEPLSLRPVPWDEFFDKFEEKHLAFVYQDESKEGERSYFYKIVGRDRQ
ncbi:MAG: hypothetical protein GF331_06835 [Chitinivibrionales bacterium]|nr:hypothetical protein [Chitinivibrionales bacterium]